MLPGMKVPIRSLCGYYRDLFLEMCAAQGVWTIGCGNLLRLLRLWCLVHLSRLKACVQAGLNVGCTPVESGETIYQRTPIIGVTKVYQAEDAAKAAALKLTADEMETMERPAGETPLNVIRYW